MKVIIVRHGRTAWHVEGRCAGRGGVPLDEVGREQAERVAERLEGEGIVATFSSPVSRCLELAEISARGLGLEVQTDERLSEINLGHWEGKKLQELIEADRELVARWIQNPMSVGVPGGESLGEVQERGLEWLLEASSRYGDSTIMVCSHGALIRTMLSAVIGLPLENIFRLIVDLASISVFEYGPHSMSLASLNERSHLDGLDSFSLI